MDADVTDDGPGLRELETRPENFTDAASAGIALAVHDDHATVVVHGELDMGNASQLWDHTRAAYATPGLRAVLIDLTDALFLESLTIAVLLEVAKEAARRRLEIGVVVGETSVARRVLTLARVDGLLNLFDTEPAALRSLLGRRPG